MVMEMGEDKEHYREYNEQDNFPHPEYADGEVTVQQTPVTDDIEAYVPSIDAIEQLRKQRDIKRGHLSHALGFTSDSAYASAVEREYMGADVRLLSLFVFALYDHFGYLPVVMVE